METTLYVNFNSRFVDNCAFKIINPPVLPLEGDTFCCQWSDFINEKEKLDILEKYDENGLWKVYVMFKEFRKSGVDVYIALFEEEHYFEELRERKKRIGN